MSMPWLAASDRIFTVLSNARPLRAYVTPASLIAATTAVYALCCASADTSSWYTFSSPRLLIASKIGSWEFLAEALSDGKSIPLFRSLNFFA